MNKREIKFRAWDKTKQRMEHGSNSLIFDCYWDKEDCIMQYTGLKDSKGQDIYEGDVVKLSFDRYNKQETYKVYYDSEKACFGPFHHLIDEEKRWMDVWYKVEIIGNIYENPELVNV